MHTNVECMQAKVAQAEANKRAEAIIETERLEALRQAEQVERFRMALFH
jgi:multidrug resistance efflux pump